MIFDSRRKFHNHLKKNPTDKRIHTVVEFYPDGKKKSFMQFKGRLYHGKHRLYWPNGKINLLANYKDGVMSRLMIRGENGEKIPDFPDAVY